MRRFSFQESKCQEERGSSLTVVAAVCYQTAVRGVLISLTHIVLNIYVELNNFLHSVKWGWRVLKLEYAQFLLICFEEYLQGSGVIRYFVFVRMEIRSTFTVAIGPIASATSAMFLKLVSYKSFPTSFLLGYK